MNELISSDELFDDYGIEDRYKDKYPDEIDVNNSKLANSSTEIEKLIRGFEYRMHGYLLVAGGEKLARIGKALCGESTIQKIMMLLHPFSEKILLISNKTKFNWAKQEWETRNQFNSIVAKNVDIDNDVNSFPLLWRTFTNLMFNIRDIILNNNSKDLISSILGIERQKSEEENSFMLEKHNNHEGEV